MKQKNFLSKIMESFVLGWAREEVVPKDNQFGEEPRSGTEHFFVQAMNKISSALGDNRSAVVLTAVDFSKVFNRIEHGACLNTFCCKSFLSGHSTNPREIPVRLHNVSKSPEGSPCQVRQLPDPRHHPLICPQPCNRGGKGRIKTRYPSFLRGLFRLFESHGATLRAKYGVVKRSIRFDDVQMSLQIDVTQ